MSYQLIETKTLGSDAASISFTSIPQDATDLAVLISVRTTQVISSWSDVVLRFNGSTSNYSDRLLYSDSGGGAGALTETSFTLRVSMASDTANTFSSNQAYIANYSGATAKSVSIENVQETNATSAFNAIITGLWNDTAAITSLSLTAASGNLVAGTMISLYKITKGSSGGVVVS
jgi:hypothetical protein